MVLQMPDPWFFCIYILFSWSLWTRLPWGNIIWRDNSKEVERSESMADEGTLELLNWVDWIHPQVHWHFHIQIQCDKQGGGRGTKQTIQERDVRVWNRITLVFATNNSSGNQLGLFPIGHCTSLQARKPWSSTSADVVNWFCNGELLAHIWSHGLEGWCSFFLFFFFFLFLWKMSTEIFNIYVERCALTSVFLELFVRLFVVSYYNKDVLIET